MEVSGPVPVGTMFIRLRSFSKCPPAPRQCALQRRKQTRSSGHTQKRMRNTLLRRRTEAHLASSGERDGVFPHTDVHTENDRAAEALDNMRLAFSAGK